ncbi:hypothetical protein THAOC_19960, partial [Thalassiosira oceanica]
MLPRRLTTLLSRSDREDPRRWKETMPMEGTERWPRGDIDCWMLKGPTGSPEAKQRRESGQSAGQIEDRAAEQHSHGCARGEREHGRRQTQRLDGQEMGRVLRGLAGTRPEEARRDPGGSRPVRETGQRCEQKPPGSAAIPEGPREATRGDRRGRGDNAAEEEAEALP